VTADRLAQGRLPAVIFGVLVVATVAAFFVTQRLKRSTPVVTRISMPVYVSPNGDGRKDTARIKFFLPKADHVTVSMTDANGDEVRRLADRHLSRGRHRFRWNGRDSSGAIAPDGTYFLRVILNGEGRGTSTRRGIQLVTRPPLAKLLSVTPNRVQPGARNVVTIHFNGPSNPKPLFTVFRTDLPGRPRVVRRFTGTIGSNTATWDERLASGRPAPLGTYAFAVTTQNKARVSGSSPRRLPPTPATAAPRTGLTIGGLTAAAPLGPVRAGSVVRVPIDGVSGPVRFGLRPLRTGRRTKPLVHGAGRPPAIRLRLPHKLGTGVYALHIAAARSAVTVPLAVRGAAAGRVLVVLPAITWQGLNPVDDDTDGFPDTLDDSRAVPLHRGFSRSPAGFASDTAPLLRFLDANKLRYDLTTDVALAQGAGPKLDGRPGVVFAGSTRWFTEQLDARLRDYVQGGGRVASFGTDAFRRTVELSPTQLAAPSPPQGTNALGEQTAPSSSAAAPLVVNPGDTLGLFAGTDGFVGLFTRFEQSQGRVPGADLLASAGRDPDKPALVAYKLGGGTVIRVGTPQWSAALSSDPEVANVTTSLWSYLSR
jgi:flagellar hook assembly protein FlgD